LAEETTVSDGAVLDVRRICGRAANEDIFQQLVVSLDLRWRAARLGSDLPDEGRMLFQIIVVFQRQVLVASLRRGDGVGVFEILERIEALNGKRLGAYSRDLFVNVNVEALN